MVQYLDVQTYASNTLKMVSVLEGVVSSTEQLSSTNHQILGMVGELNKMQGITTDALSGALDIQKATIYFLMFLLFLSFRKEIFVIAYQIYKWFAGYISIMLSWDKEKKLEKILFPIGAFIAGIIFTSLAPHILSLFRRLH